MFKGFAFALKKKKYVAVIATFVLLIARLLHLHYDRHKLWAELLNKYDTQKDSRLDRTEVLRYLKDNGIEVTGEQFTKWMGSIDDEKDGFSQDEMKQVIDRFEDFDGTGKKLQDFDDAYDSYVPIVGDSLLAVITGIGLVFILSHSQGLEKRLATSTFASAVKMSRMKRNWEGLQVKLNDYDEQQDQIQEKMRKLKETEEQAAQRACDLDEQCELFRQKTSMNAETLKLSDEERAQAKEDARIAREQYAAKMTEFEQVAGEKKRVEDDLKKVRQDTEKHFNEAHDATAKLKAMRSVLNGIDSFTGTGKGKWQNDGATAGFVRQGVGGFARSNSRNLSRNLTSSGGSQAKSSSGFKSESSFVFGYPTDDDIQLFEVDKRKNFLGEGADGAYYCRNISNGEKMALKIYEVSENAPKKQIMNDLRAKSSLKGDRPHPNIVDYDHIIETEKQIFVLMELIDGRDLFSDIIEFGGLSEDRTRKIFGQLCEAVGFCHDQGVIHGDLKPENVMIKNFNTDEPLVKLIDFGFSAFLNLADGEVALPVRDIYATPEALSEGKVTKESDMFRLGCTLYVMLMATYPFDQNAGHIQKRREGKVAEYPKWKTLSENARSMITTLVKDRPSVDQVFEHAFMKGYQCGQN